MASQAHSTFQPRSQVEKMTALRCSQKNSTLRIQIKCSQWV
jgi:hypothetical protein